MLNWWKRVAAAQKELDEARAAQLDMEKLETRCTLCEMKVSLRQLPEHTDRCIKWRTLDSLRGIERELGIIRIALTSMAIRKQGEDLEMGREG